MVMLCIFEQLRVEDLLGGCCHIRVRGDIGLDGFLIVIFHHFHYLLLQSVLHNLHCINTSGYQAILLLKCRELFRYFYLILIVCIISEISVDLLVYLLI